VARYGMLIDLTLCAQCSACTVACEALYGLPAGESGVHLRSFETGRFPAVERITLPVQCMHCQEPPCVQVCPTGATYRDPATGTVQMDYERCVGCRYCMTACPYGARQFDEAQGTVAKCVFCASRVKQGLQPACVETCIGQARLFGDLDDPTSEVSRAIAERKAVPLHPELGTQPSVFYVF
jgi:Fe-S-cluster-containing dehydrogenase component